MPFPKEWTEALDKLRAVGATDAVIAGGAVRDFLLGRPIKDIDVFTRSRGYEEDKRIVLEAFPNAQQIAHDLSDYHPQFAELASIWHVPPLPLDGFDRLFYADDLPVQIIHLHSQDDMTVQYVVDRIDMGLCRVGFDGTLYATKDFMHDLLNQQMTVRRLMSPENLARSTKRFERLSQKYPSYTFARTPIERPDR